MFVRVSGVAPPFMLIPPTPSFAKGTWLWLLTVPVSLALLETSTYSVPPPPLILTVGRLTVMSSSYTPSDFWWPWKVTPPAYEASNAPVPGS